MLLVHIPSIIPHGLLVAVGSFWSVPFLNLPLRMQGVGEVFLPPTILIPLLLLSFLCCYGRNHDTSGIIWP
jgi:hypothetical protein